VSALKLAQGVPFIRVLCTVFDAEGVPVEVQDTAAAETGASSAMR
jgi:hypothetical protein